MVALRLKKKETHRRSSGDSEDLSKRLINGLCDAKKEIVLWHRFQMFYVKSIYNHLGCDIGGAKELGVIYFPTNWGAKEPQNLPNHRVAIHFTLIQFTLSCCQILSFEKEPQHNLM